MELMTLGSNRGIAGMLGLKTKDDVLRHIPFERHHTYCDGSVHNGVAVYAVLKNGEQRKLDTSGHYSDGNNYIPDTEECAPTIGEQIAGMPVDALIFHHESYGQNEAEDWEEYLPITPPDWKVIRRRVEDALRKNTDNATLFSFANKLNCKIY